MINHIKRWNEWRKHNRNGKFYKVLVLFKLAHSPSFNLFLSSAKWRGISEGMERGIKQGEANPIRWDALMQPFEINTIEKNYINQEYSKMIVQFELPSPCWYELKESQAWKEVERILHQMNRRSTKGSEKDG